MHFFVKISIKISILYKNSNKITENRHQSETRRQRRSQKTGRSPRGSKTHRFSAETGVLSGFHASFPHDVRIRPNNVPFRPHKIRDFEREDRGKPGKSAKRAKTRRKKAFTTIPATRKQRIPRPDSESGRFAGNPFGISERNRDKPVLYRRELRES